MRHARRRRLAHDHLRGAKRCLHRDAAEEARGRRRDEPGAVQGHEGAPVDRASLREDPRDRGGRRVEEGKVRLAQRVRDAVGRRCEPHGRRGGHRRRDDAHGAAVVGAVEWLNGAVLAEAHARVAQLEESLPADREQCAARDRRALRHDTRDDHLRSRLPKDGKRVVLGRLVVGVAVEAELDRLRRRRPHLDGGRGAARLVGPEHRRRRQQLGRRRARCEAAARRREVQQLVL